MLASTHALCTLLLLAMLASLATGGVHLSLAEIAHALTAPNDEGSRLLVDLRLPRIVLGAMVGGALALSGSTMQGLFRNPLVDPGILGVSGGAALGAVVAMVFGASALHARFALSGAAFVGALLALVLVKVLARLMGERNNANTLLAGLGVNAVASALIGMVITAATSTQLRGVTFWQFGSLADADWNAVAMTAPWVGLAAWVLPRQGASLNTLALGDDEAGHLGVDVRATQRTAVLMVALCTGSAVAVAGGIGFVGLLVPHLARLLVGHDLRRVLPASALLGATLVVLADAVARSFLAPMEIPLGVLTAALGAPAFLALLVSQRRSLA